LIAILVTHAVVDALAALVPSSLGLLEARLQLSTQQAAWLMGVGPLCSGLAQPVCALLSDRWATRRLGVWGVALSGLGVGALGLLVHFWPLVLVYALAVIGIGMFHPVAAATIGQLGEDRRTRALSLFFVAGMFGGALGALAWPRLLALPAGFDRLPLVVVPLLLVALVLGRSFARLRQPVHDQQSATAAPPGKAGRVLILYVSAVLRFCVNVALVYLFVRWVQSQVAAQHPDWSLEAVAQAAAPQVGNLNAALFVGMAIGGLSTGLLVRPGHEKGPLVWVPILFAPVIGLFPCLPLQAGLGLALAAGIGFSAMIPVTIALAQQLMPQRTNLASSLMMGGAWAVSILGPTLAEQGVARYGLTTTFVATAVTLALAGLVCVPLRVSC
jgi:FSR family fosmidomycin resistance protein-like MFS transporter